MENNPSAEPVGRGIRASVIFASLAICVLLFWGIKNVFQGGSKLDDETKLERKSSFSAVKHDPSAPSPPPSVPAPTSKVEEPAITLLKLTTTPSTATVEPVKTIPAATLTASSGASASVQSSGAATDFGMISGKVVLQGVPEPEKPLPLDPSCGNLHKGTKPTTQFHVVAGDGGLADVFVHIVKGLENRNFLPPEKALVLDQIGCVYVPYVGGAQVGQTIEVRNSDPLLHNVHPTPAVAGNKEANKAHLPKAAPLLFRWDNPEVFLRFKCDVHPWMFSYIGLVNHPYFAVTDANGNFTIQNVPPGNYTVELYHRKSGKISKDIIVNAGHTTAITVSMEVIK
ncbi:MAG TPA: carboxypeptidase regulatory-like domain-containing protein [Verrucomicrobiae bacterium]